MWHTTQYVIFDTICDTVRIVLYHILCTTWYTWYYTDTYRTVCYIWNIRRRRETKYWCHVFMICMCQVGQCVVSCVVLHLTYYILYILFLCHVSSIVSCLIYYMRHDTILDTWHKNKMYTTQKNDTQHNTWHTNQNVTRLKTGKRHDTRHKIWHTTYHVSMW